jgi:hypothetical protein
MSLKRLNAPRLHQMDDRRRFGNGTACRNGKGRRFALVTLSFAFLHWTISLLVYIGHRTPSHLISQAPELVFSNAGVEYEGTNIKLPFGNLLGLLCEELFCFIE